MALFVYPAQPITATGSGLATEIKQDTQITLATTLNAKDFATQATLLTVKTDTGLLVAKDFATQTTLLTVKTDTGLLVAKDFSTEATLLTVKTDTGTLASAVTASKVQVDVITSALPSGAATSANQTTEIGHLATLAGTVAGTEIQVDVLTMPSVTVTATNLDIRDLTSVSDSVSAVQSGTWNITNVSGTVSLPTGASTSALQTTGNSSLSSLDGKVPANLTVTATRLLTDGSGVTQPVSAASLPLPAGASTEATLSTLNGKVPANLTVTATRLLTDGSGVTQPVSGTFFQATQPVSGTFFQATQPVSGTFFQGTQPVSGPLTNTELRATAVPVSGPLTDTQLRAVAVPVSLAAVPLPSGAATETSLATVLTNTNRLGPVDQLDTPLVDISSTNIPASASSPTQFVASTAAAVRKIIVVDDIGEFIGLYTGAAAAEVLHCILPLGGGEMEVSIPASTRISLRNMKNTALTLGFISINFLG